jgi:hypothetical protein
MLLIKTIPFVAETTRARAQCAMHLGGGDHIVVGRSEADETR